MTRIVISGTAASGKTTLARRLGDELSWPVIDKDDFLEALYEGFDEYGPELRHRLSRQADERFIEAASTTTPAIIVSFWARDERSSRAGTPTGWLHGLGEVVEVYCSCPPEIAAERFVNRRRHPGHCDPTELSDDVTQRFRETSAFGPIGLARCITVDTSRPVVLDQVVAELARAHESRADRARGLTSDDRGGGSRSTPTRD